MQSPVEGVVPPKEKGSGDEDRFSLQTGDSTPGKRKQRRENKGFHDIAKYLHLLSLSQPGKVDTSELQVWAQRMTNGLYIFWVFLVICGSFINGVIVFSFHLTKAKLASITLAKVFLESAVCPYSIVGAMLTCMILPTWGCMMLIYPNPKSKFVYKARWAIPIFLGVYILFCFFSQMAECGDLRGDIVSSLKKEMNRSEENSTSKLIDTTQTYLQCCGIEGHKDWADVGKGYPLSCCDTKRHLGCDVPVNETNEKGEFQVWIKGCAGKEYELVGTIVGLVGFVELVVAITGAGACKLLWVVVESTKGGAIELAHPFQ